MRARVARRDVLRAGAALAALAALPGCDPLMRALAGIADPLPERFGIGGGAKVDPLFHLLSRAAYGPRPGDLDRVREIGREVWLEQQLHPDTIDDSACDLRVSDCELAFDPPQELMSVPERAIDRDLVRSTLIRAVHSRRQLLEVMVRFWSDHFSIDTGKRGCVQAKPMDDREVVRRHALGPFRDLVRASATSRAMLVYLDGAENRAARGARPNENYARELLELHTLGVRGGYTQRDVMEAARCLTGWTIESRLKHLFKMGDVVFRRDLHDDGEKVVLGTRIPAGSGEADLDALLDIVCTHPATARHIATKLCRRLVSDPPPESLVASAAEVFAAHGGDTTIVLRHVLTSPEFAASTGAKVKRPFRFVASALRAVGAECRAGPREIDFLTRLGHVPFHYPTPDGYPEEPEPWMGTLLWRWNFALALSTQKLGSTTVDLEALARRAGLDPAKAPPTDLAPLFFGRVATAEERAAIDAFAAREGGARSARRAESVALLLCAPGFQVH